jgi:hypothetical protein
VNAVKFLGIAAVGLFLGSWGAAYIKLPPANPQPRYSGPILSAKSDPILRDSCFDCHSNETRYRWYDYLPGALHLVSYDVLKGRKELNFSEWDQLGPNKKARKLKEMREQIEEGEMPPFLYTLVYGKAKLTDQAAQQLLLDVAAAGGAKGAAKSGAEGASEERAGKTAHKEEKGKEGKERERH